MPLNDALLHRSFRFLLALYNVLPSVFYLFFASFTHTLASGLLQTALHAASHSVDLVFAEVLSFRRRPDITSSGNARRVFNALTSFLEDISNDFFMRCLLRSHGLSWGHSSCSSGNSGRCRCIKVSTRRRRLRRGLEKRIFPDSSSNRVSLLDSRLSVVVVKDRVELFVQKIIIKLAWVVLGILSSCDFNVLVGIRPSLALSPAVALFRLLDRSSWLGINGQLGKRFSSRISFNYDSLLLHLLLKAVVTSLLISFFLRDDSLCCFSLMLLNLSKLSFDTSWGTVLSFSFGETNRSSLALVFPSSTLLVIDVLFKVSSREVNVFLSQSIRKTLFLMRLEVRVHDLVVELSWVIRNLYCWRVFRVSSAHDFISHYWGRLVLELFRESITWPIAFFRSDRRSWQEVSAN